MIFKLGLLAFILLGSAVLVAQVEATPISYQSVRCGEDRDVWGRVNFTAPTPSFSVYLQARVPSQNNSGTEWLPVINSSRNVAPAPTDTSADFGPLDTAFVPQNADRLRIANTLNDDRSEPVIPCNLPFTPSPTATVTPTATLTPAATQTPHVVTATATPSPQPTQEPQPTAVAPVINVFVPPPQVVLPSLPAASPAPAVQTPSTQAPFNGGSAIRPPNTGSGGLLD